MEWSNSLTTWVATAKLQMLEACVRRACLAESGEVDTKLHHVREQSRVASACLVIHACDRSHSVRRRGANAMKDDTEITITDQLLVTGKKPYSLAKFLSTSMVFRKTVGDAQLVKNFGTPAFQQSGETLRT